MITTNKHAFLRLMNQCDIYLDDLLISQERIIQKYMEFFTSALNEPSHALSVVQHPGSVCFDAVSFLIAALGCWALNDTANDDVIRSFEHGQMVLWSGGQNKQRYLWRGFAKQINESFVASHFEDAEYAVLEQPSNHSAINYEPRNRWNLISPYQGVSTRTDGRGIRRTRSNRNDFIS